MSSSWTNYNILGGRLSWGVDDISEVHYKANARYRVINFTHPYISIGVTTSGGLGLWISRAAKRGGKEGETHTVFRGFLSQIGFHWFKAYLYVYFDGTGME